MDSLALALVLAAAVVHAVWNLLLAGSRDSRAVVAPALACGAVALAPAAAATWDVRWSAVPWMAASVAFELVYFALLARAYDVGELSFVYPIARGTGPVLVLLVSVVVLGVSLSVAASVGVLLVAGGVLAVGARSRPARPGAGDLPLALGVGACIAGYTLVDKEGLHHAGPLPYLAVVLTATAAALLAGRALRPGRERGRSRPALTTVVAGLGMAGAYALTLGALTRAPAAPVAALRETSIVIATALAALTLHEPVGPRRLAGAAVVAAGVALVAVS